jgi:D-3-phosphoglycerate dehydrogenase / 2-oxoglutarate reductase
MNVLICDPISAKGIALFRGRPEFKVTVLDQRLSEADLVKVVAEADALVVRSETKITRKVLEAATQLKVVGRAGVGVDNVDVDAATERGVVVMNTPGGNTVTTAELTFFMLGALARNVPAAHATMISGKWDRKLFQGTEISGKTLGVLGAGRIGSEVAKRALAFGMRVLAYDPFLTEARARQLGIEAVLEPDVIYREADFLTVHMPVTKETRGMINATSIARMKPGVRIVNCARGEIINEADLIAGLESGKIGGAALDVFAMEPLPADHPFRRLKNVVLTPHLGASTEEAQEKCGIEVAEILTSFLLTGEVRNAVNLPGVDAKTYEQVKPYITLGEKLGKLLGQLAPSGVDRLHVTYGGNAQHLPATDPITRAILTCFLTDQGARGVNPINVRSLAQAQGLTVEEKKSSEPVTFNEWLHVQAFAGERKVISSGGTFFGSPNNPRIVRLFSLPVEIVPEGVIYLMNNKDRPGIVGHIGTLFGRHNVNIASMSLSRDSEGGQALTVLNLDSVPPAELLAEVAKDPDISNVHVVKL